MEISQIQLERMEQLGGFLGLELTTLCHMTCTDTAQQQQCGSAVENHG